MMVSEIDAAELKRRMDADEKFVLYDIRSDGEVAQGTLPDSEHLHGRQFQNCFLSRFVFKNMLG